MYEKNTCSGVGDVIKPKDEFKETDTEFTGIETDLLKGENISARDPDTNYLSKQSDSKTVRRLSSGNERIKKESMSGTHHRGVEH